MKSCYLTNIPVCNFACCFVVVKYVIICFDVENIHDFDFNSRNIYLCWSYNTIINSMQSDDIDTLFFMTLYTVATLTLGYCLDKVLNLYFHGIKSAGVFYSMPQNHVAWLCLQHVDYTAITVPLRCSLCTRIAVQVPVYIFILGRQHPNKSHKVDKYLNDKLLIRCFSRFSERAW